MVKAYEKAKELGFLELAERIKTNVESYKNPFIVSAKSIYSEIEARVFGYPVVESYKDVLSRRVCLSCLIPS